MHILSCYTPLLISGKGAESGKKGFKNNDKREKSLYRLYSQLGMSYRNFKHMADNKTKGVKIEINALAAYEMRKAFHMPQVSMARLRVKALIWPLYVKEAAVLSRYRREY